MTSHKKIITRLLASSSVMAALWGAEVASAYNTYQSFDSKDINLNSMFESKSEEDLAQAGVTPVDSSAIPPVQDFNSNPQVFPTIEVKGNEAATSRKLLANTENSALRNGGGLRIQVRDAVRFGEPSAGIVANESGGSIVRIQMEQNNLPKGLIDVSGHVVLKTDKIEGDFKGFNQTRIVGNNSLIELQGADTKEYTGDILFVDGQGQAENIVGHIVFSEDGTDQNNPTPIDQNFTGKDGHINIVGKNRNITGNITGENVSISFKESAKISNSISPTNMFFDLPKDFVMDLANGVKITSSLDVGFVAQVEFKGDSKDPAWYVVPANDSKGLATDGDINDADIRTRSTITFINTNVSGEGIIETFPPFTTYQDEIPILAGIPSRNDAVISYYNYTDDGSGNAIPLEIDVMSDLHGVFLDIEGSYDIKKPQGEFTSLGQSFRNREDTMPATRFVKLYGTDQDVQRISTRIIGIDQGIYTRHQTIKAVGSGADLLSPKFIAESTTFDTTEGNFYIGMSEADAEAEKTYQENNKTALTSMANNLKAIADQELDDAKDQDAIDEAQARVNRIASYQNDIAKLEITPELDAPYTRLDNIKIKLHGDGKNVFWRSDDNRIIDAINVDVKVNKTGLDIAAPLALPLKDDGTIALSYYKHDADNTEEIIMTTNSKYKEKRDEKLIIPQITQTDENVKYRISLSNISLPLNKIFSDATQEKTLPTPIIVMRNSSGDIVHFSSENPQNIIEFYNDLKTRIEFENINTRLYRIELTDNLKLKFTDLRDSVLDGIEGANTEDFSDNIVRLMSRNSNGKIPKIGLRIGVIAEEQGVAKAKIFSNRINGLDRKKLDNNTINSAAQISRSISNVVSERINTVVAISAGDDAVTSKSFGMWMEPFYQTSHQKENGKDAGYMANNYGFTTGFDVMAGESSMLGFAGSFTKSTVRYRGGDSNTNDRTKINNALAFIYGSHSFQSNFLLDGKLIYGQSRVKTIEMIEGEEVISRHKVNIYGAELMGRYKWKAKNGVQLTPSLGLVYTYFNRRDSDIEQEGQAQGRIITRNDFYKMEIMAGMSISSDFKSEESQLVVTPEISVSLRYDMNNGRLDTTTNFEDATGEATPVSFSPARSALDIRAGINFTQNNIEYGFKYDATFSRKYQSHKGSIRVRINF